MASDPLLSRRALVAGASGIALASSVPAAIGTARSNRLILGSGSHRYECIHDWLVAPAGLAFGDTHGVAQDSKGNIYIAHTVHSSSKSKDAICVYTEQGKFLRSWGAQFVGGAHGLDIRREGRKEYIYHCDVAHNRVTKTTLMGETVFSLGAPMESGKYPNGNGFVPTNVAFSPNGDFYVADGYGSHWIHQHRSDGTYLRTFGGYGSDRGQVKQPHGIWLDGRSGNPILAVADRANRRIQYFDLDGRHIRFALNGMRQPCHFSTRGTEMLVPDLDSVITILDAKNEVIVQLGDGYPTDLRGQSRDKYIPGKFIHPHDAMFLRNGDILVAEWVPTGRITLLKKL